MDNPNTSEKAYVTHTLKTDTHTRRTGKTTSKIDPATPRPQNRIFMDITEQRHIYNHSRIGQIKKPKKKSNRPIHEQTQN
jgi:hypothetical protein